MIELKFDADRMFKDLVDLCIIPAANHAIESVYKFIVRGLVMNQDIQKRTITPVEIEDTEFDAIANTITATCASYGWSILVSYGTGEYIDRSNPELEEYIRSNLWNPLRYGSYIVGRKRGTYESVIGKRKSKGKRAGKRLSGWRTLRYGIKPNYAIQNAEKRLEKGVEPGGFVYRILDSYVEQFFVSHPFDNYFYEEER